MRICILECMYCVYNNCYCLHYIMRLVSYSIQKYSRKFLLLDKYVFSLSNNYYSNSVFSGKFSSVIVVFVFVGGVVVMCFGEFMSMGDMFSVCNVCVFGLRVIGDKVEETHP